MANNPEGAETFHEVPASKYYYLGDTIGAVPKAFFKYWSALLICGSVTATVLACETNFWQQLLAYIYIKNALISIPITALTLLITWYMYSRKQKQKARQKAEAAHRRQFEEATINQAGGGKRR
jgi:hypothetical protein